MSKRYLTLRGLSPWVPAFLLCLAIGAYAYSLVVNLASLHARNEVRFTQRYGIAANVRDGAQIVRETGGILLRSTSARVAKARWQLRVPADASAQAPIVHAEELFIAGEDVRFSSPAGYATISLDERTVAVLHPGPGQFPDAPSAGPDASAAVIDVPPEARRGFRFDIPPGSDCLVRRCSIEVRIYRGHWNIEAVGLRFETQAAQGPPLWRNSDSAWLAVAVGIVVAALSGIIVFIWRRFARGGDHGARPPVWSTFALAALVAASIALISYQGRLPSSGANLRTELQERLGTETDAGSSGSSKSANTLLLRAGPDRIASASWSMLDYEFAHVLARAQTCSLDVYVAGPDLWGSGSRAQASIDLNGERITAIPFGRDPGDYRFLQGSSYPQIKPAVIAMTPLFHPYGLVFPVAPRFCTAEKWNVRVGLRDALWTIDRVGIFARFSPSGAASRTAQPPTIIVALVLASLLILAVHVLFESVLRRYGLWALALTLGVCIVALLTHDEWDFAVWLRFVDLVALGHGNPAGMWGGTPLWPFMTALLAPVLSSVYALTGDGSQEVTALFLKVAMALAVCGNAMWLAREAPRRLGRFLFPVYLLSPLGLYTLAGGYREAFAGSFLLVGCSLALRSRYLVSAFAFSCAASVSESVAPLVFLPLCLRLGRRREERRGGAESAGFALLDAAAGVLPIAILWRFIPQNFLHTVLATRITSAYRFGGASWLASLDAYGLLPAWVGPHSLEIFAALFLALALPLVVLLARAVFLERSSVPRERDIFGCFVGFVVAFLLAYRGTDPATLYTLLVLVSFYFARYDAANPYPLFFSTLGGFVFYAILGIGDFANWTYLMPRNESLLGVLGKPMSIGVLAVHLSILALYASLVARNGSLLFGRGSAYFCVLFAAAAATVAVKMYAADIVFCASAAMLLLLAFERLARSRDRAVPWRRTTALDFTGSAIAIVAGAWTGMYGAPAALSAFVALLVGLVYGFGLCDIVLVVASSLLLASQRGFGWVSIAGYIAMSLLALGAIRLALRARSGAAAIPPLPIRGRDAAA